MENSGFPVIGSRQAAKAPHESAIPLAGSREEPLVDIADSYLPLDEDQTAAPIADPTAVEPGRSLALADFAPPALGAGDRLVRLAYRMGLPASAIHPFRKRAKTRLTATVTPPLPGDPAAGKALRAGHFLVHGFKSPIADTAFSEIGRAHV